MSYSSANYFSYAIVKLLFEWWAQVDSNHRPHAYQACALTELSYEPISSGGDERNRTAGLLLARQALSQLSYTPVCSYHSISFFEDALSTLKTV